VNHRQSYCLLVALIALSLTSCHHTKAPVTKRYPFTGRIISIAAQDQSAVIDGDTIPGFMSAMTMGYKIKPPSTLTQLAAGDSISAEVVVIQSGEEDAASDYWLENVKVTAHSKTPPQAPTSQRVPAPGDEVPDFAFTNQDGKPISLAHYRGQVLLVTFIYTRCPYPDFCPRMSRNFAEIVKHFAADSTFSKRAHLLTISFDPEHDTPKALRAYAFSVANTHDPALFKQWEFAVPGEKDLPQIATFFGLVVQPEGGLITHNLSTTVIAPDGKIAKWYHGGDWQVSDLIIDATDALARKS